MTESVDYTIKFDGLVIPFKSKDIFDIAKKMETSGFTYFFRELENLINQDGDNCLDRSDMSRLLLLTNDIRYIIALAQLGVSCDLAVSYLEYEIFQLEHFNSRLKYFSPSVAYQQDVLYFYKKKLIEAVYLNNASEPDQELLEEVFSSVSTRYKLNKVKMNSCINAHFCVVYTIIIIILFANFISYYFSMFDKLVQCYDTALQADDLYDDFKVNNITSVNYINNIILDLKNDIDAANTCLLSSSYIKTSYHSYLTMLLVFSGSYLTIYNNIGREYFSSKFKSFSSYKKNNSKDGVILFSALKNNKPNEILNNNGVRVIDNIDSRYEYKPIIYSRTTNISSNTESENIKNNLTIV